MSSAADATRLGIALLSAALLGARPLQVVSPGTGHGATITSSLPAGRVLHPGEQVVFTVHSTHAHPDLVSLALLDPPPGCVVTPRPPTAATATGGAASASGVVVTAVVEVRWLVPPSVAGLRRLLFRAIDHTHPAETVAAAFDVRVDGGGASSAIQVGDVTGDGVLDTVAAATRADRAPAADVGAIHVWNGAAAPSSAPDATLLVPGAVALDKLGSAGVQLADVTGDGRLDVVACASLADVAGAKDAGALYVWKGGPALHGPKAPLATLTVPGAAPQDQLGSGGGGQKVQFADVTGDGLVDLIVTASLADLAGVADAGAIQIWKGGATLVGASAPYATLTVPGAAAGDRLGDAIGQGVQFADVNGDGVLDVVAGAPLADVAGVADAGAIHLWSGGATLGGVTPLLATLTIPAGAAFDRLGASSARAIHLADVTADGFIDVIAAASAANVGGVGDAGAVFVWEGGTPMLGAPPPLATLRVAGAIAGDSLGALAGADPGIELADVTGDAIPDVVVASSFADVGGVADAGAIHVWQGSAALRGRPPPRATLTVPGAKAGDQLGSSAFLLADLDGDFTLDLIAGASRADVGAATDAGAIHVWRGGAALAGAPAPLATLAASGAVAFDRLGETGGSGIQVGDVSGDGLLDVVAGASIADVNGTVDAGAIRVWSGGAALAGTPAPLATLAVPGALFGDQLGAVAPGFQLADLSGDGVLDVISGSHLADVAGVANAGAIHLWKGGAALAGAPAPLATLKVPGAVADDRLGSAAGQAIQLADVTGDGQLDVIAGANLADVASASNVGAIHVWKGGAALAGTPAPHATLAVAGAAANDQLGVAAGQGILLADVTGDDVLDVIGGASLADVGGVAGVGAIQEWRGGPTLAGAAPLLQRMTVPGAVAFDALGN